MTKDDTAKHDRFALHLAREVLRAVGDPFALLENDGDDLRRPILLALLRAIKAVKDYAAAVPKPIAEDDFRYYCDAVHIVASAAWAEWVTRDEGIGCDPHSMGGELLCCFGKVAQMLGAADALRMATCENGEDEIADDADDVIRILETDAP